jgi:two-component system phosphate regulon sensor histidine kinase PhoR
VPLPRTLLAAAALSAAPGAVLVGLAAAGRLDPGWALLGFAVCAGAALGIAWLYVSAVYRLAQALRRAAEERGPLSAPLPAPRLPALGQIQDGLARLTRAMEERTQAMERLRSADRAILEALPDPLLILGADRQLLRANSAARRFLNLAEGATGDLGALLRHPLLAEALDAAQAEGKPQRRELFLPLPVPRDLAARVFPADPPLPDGGRFVLLLIDRTAARAVERMREDFVANASHELRTPLASVIGFIETLRGPARDDPAAQERFLGIMADQADRMRRLVDDLLGLSRIEMTEHQPPTGTADLAALLRAEAAALEPLLAARRVRLRLDLPEDLPEAAPADAEQLAQVIRNLVENAIRHGREGGEVTVSAGPDQQGGRAGIVLAVADDGPGIAREHIPRLTERFYRVDRGRSRTAGGTGLGLAIVKHIVARHRGQLSIESEVGKGARFRVWLPTA